MNSQEGEFHVLAVDDSHVDRKLLEKMLKASSFQVTAVDSGKKALEFLGLNDSFSSSNSKSQSPRFDVNLIITDYSMPGMSGLELLRKIKESECFKDVPVIVMSSENVQSRINRCLDEGAEDFLLKPVHMLDVRKLRPCLLKRRT